MGFVFEFAYKKLQDRQKPENWCRAFNYLIVIMHRTAMLVALYLGKVGYDRRDTALRLERLTSWSVQNTPTWITSPTFMPSTPPSTAIPTISSLQGHAPSRSSQTRIQSIELDFTP